MVHKKAGALALVSALLMSGSAFAEQRVLKYNADYDPIPLAAMEALIADFEAANPDVDAGLSGRRVPARSGSSAIRPHNDCQFRCRCRCRGTYHCCLRPGATGG